MMAPADLLRQREAQEQNSSGTGIADVQELGDKLQDASRNNGAQKQSRRKRRRRRRSRRRRKTKECDEAAHKSAA